MSLLDDAIARYEESRELLSVDDDPVNQMVISSLFESEGFVVHQAMDGFEALEHMQNNPLPDLILLDVMMPGMSGYEVLDTLRAEYPPDLPVVMISAKAAVADKVEGVEHFCNDYQTKPFEKEELLARVRCLIILRHMINAHFAGGGDGGGGGSDQTSMMKGLPPHIAEKIKQGESNISERYDKASFLYVVFDKFAEVAEAIPLPQLLTLLNKLQTSFVEAREASFQAIHLKFVGVNTIAVAGFDDESANCEELLCGFGQECLARAAEIMLGDYPISKLMKIGIHTGPAFAGLIGSAFAFMGSPSQLSRQLALGGVCGHVHVSKPTKEGAEASAAGSLHFGERGTIKIGDEFVETFLVKRSEDEDLSEYRTEASLNNSGGDMAEGLQKRVKELEAQLKNMMSGDGNDDAEDSLAKDVAKSGQVPVWACNGIAEPLESLMAALEATVCTGDKGKQDDGGEAPVVTSLRAVEGEIGKLFEAINAIEAESRATQKTVQDVASGKVALKGDNVKGAGGFNLADEDRETLNTILEGLDTEFTKLQDGTPKAPASGVGVSPGEVDAIVKEIETVMKTVGSLEKICQDNTTAVKEAKGLIDEKQKEIEALTAGGASDAAKAKDDGTDFFADAALSGAAEGQAASGEPMVPASELAAVKKELEDTKAALISAKTAAATSGGGGGGVEAMMGMMSAMMQQQSHAAHSQKEPSRGADAGAGGGAGGVMKIQLEALEAECDRLRHDAAQAKSLATEVVFLKRQVAELEMEGTMKNTDADTVESLKAQAENSVLSSRLLLMERQMVDIKARNKVLEDKLTLVGRTANDDKIKQIVNDADLAFKDDLDDTPTVSTLATLLAMSNRAQEEMRQQMEMLIEQSREQQTQRPALGFAGLTQGSRPSEGMPLPTHFDSTMRSNGGFSRTMGWPQVSTKRYRPIY
ncbi:hypothetical protein FOZ60_012830 [Perkinsus olseni]|uniref:Response regulatory domain-containing protein n=2 Tax=Perkinsus olseni TaxID=32597 RepID=A0A7J6PA08_PEROL|nr:hypothetical protein FOZ60_012830 [Perkinsus olseni]